MSRRKNAISLPSLSSCPLKRFLLCFFFSHCPSSNIRHSLLQRLVNVSFSLSHLFSLTNLTLKCCLSVCVFFFRQIAFPKNNSIYVCIFIYKIRMAYSTHLHMHIQHVFSMDVPYACRILMMMMKENRLLLHCVCRCRWSFYRERRRTAKKIG